MAKEVIMPKFGFTQEESQVVEWLVKDGDTVEAGDPLLEVTTDKVNMEVEAPATGVIRGIRVAAGEIVPVTAIIAYILAPGEALPEAPPLAPAAAPPPPDATPAPQPAAQPAAAHAATPVAARLAAASGVDLQQVPGSGRGGRVTREDVNAYLANGVAAPQAINGKVRATPAARRLAREQAIDLAGLSGSGPRQRVQAADVIAAPVPVPQPSAPDPQSPVPGPQRVPMSTMRRTIARTMQRSMQEAPHITFQADIDMTALEGLVASANAARGENDEKVSLTAAITKAAAWALVRNPLLNSTLGDDAVNLWPEANIGMAVALDDGLLVPVIHSVGSKGIAQLSAEIRDLSRRARAGKLRPEELSGGTFTISNLGMFGIDRFTAIINPPEVGILAVGRTSRQFVPDAADQPVVRPICSMTLSVDHRVIDGAVAARYMADLRQAIESPQRMLL
jgi:pyruvate dehydrogenase E2 component (dihydrolipoamide acetyltransferase)